MSLNGQTSLCKHNQLVYVMTSTLLGNGIQYGRRGVKHRMKRIRYHLFYTAVDFLKSPWGPLFREVSSFTSCLTLEMGLFFKWYGFPINFVDRGNASVCRSVPSPLRIHAAYHAYGLRTRNLPVFGVGLVWMSCCCCLWAYLGLDLYTYM